jgi:hypothetical protein
MTTERTRVNVVADWYYLLILSVLLLTSKGAETVTGGGFITLAATRPAMTGKRRRLSPVTVNMPQALALKGTRASGIKTGASLLPRPATAIIHGICAPTSCTAWVSRSGSPTRSYEPPHAVSPTQTQPPVHSCTNQCSAYAEITQLRPAFFAQ